MSVGRRGSFSSLSPWTTGEGPTTFKSSEFSHEPWFYSEGDLPGKGITRLETTISRAEGS